MHHFRMSILSMFHDSKGRLVVVLCDLPCFYSENQQIKPIFWSNMTLKFSKSAQNLSQTPTPPTKQNLRCSGFATGNCRNLIYGSSLMSLKNDNEKQLKCLYKKKCGKNVKKGVDKVISLFQGRKSLPLDSPENRIFLSFLGSFRFLPF